MFEELSEKMQDIPRKGHPKFYALLEELAETHEKKNKDYARNDPLSNLKMCEAIGIPAYVGCFIRMQDKWSRLQNLMLKNPDVINEPIEDTATDLAVYCLLFKILRGESDPLLLEEWDQYIRKLFGE